MPRGRKRVESDSSEEKTRISPEMLDELIPSEISVSDSLHSLMTCSGWTLLARRLFW